MICGVIILILLLAFGLVALVGLCNSEYDRLRYEKAREKFERECLEMKKALAEWRIMLDNQRERS